MEMQLNLLAEETQLQRLTNGERVPDAKTIWLFRDTLTQKGIIKLLFEQFTKQLESQGIITHIGTIVDATFHVENRVCEKSYRNTPLTDEQKANNRKKSKIRCRIEHVFGFMTGSMHGITLRSIGIKRAKFNIGLTNLVYNICRYMILKQKEVCMR